MQVEATVNCSVEEFNKLTHMARLGEKAQATFEKLKEKDKIKEPAQIMETMTVGEAQKLLPTFIWDETSQHIVEGLFL